MNDLISRQAAITLPVFPKEYREYQTSNLDDAYEQGWMDCQEFIADLPSAEPVKHGRWIDRNGATVAPFWERYECSVCGARSDNSKYCPNCGAKMEANNE